MNNPPKNRRYIKHWERRQNHRKMHEDTDESYFRVPNNYDFYDYDDGEYDESDYRDNL